MILIISHPVIRTLLGRVNLRINFWRSGRPHNFTFWPTVVLKFQTARGWYLGVTYAQNLGERTQGKGRALAPSWPCYSSFWRTALTRSPPRMPRSPARLCSALAKIGSLLGAEVKKWRTLDQPGYRKALGNLLTNFCEETELKTHMKVWIYRQLPLILSTRLWFSKTVWTSADQWFWNTARCWKAKMWVLYLMAGDEVKVDVGNWTSGFLG